MAERVTRVDNLPRPDTAADSSALIQIGRAAEAVLEYAICMLDGHGCVTRWGDRARDMFGWTTEEAIGRDFACLFTGRDVALGLPSELLAKARAEGWAQDDGWRTSKDGSAFRTRTILRRAVDTTPTEAAFVLLIRDLTEPDAGSDSIESSAMLVRSILATVPQAMVVIDEAGTIAQFSASAEELFGYSASEVRGRNVSMLMPSPDREAHDEYLRRYRETGEAHIIGTFRRVLGRAKDGRAFPHDLMVGEAQYDGRRVFVGFMRDLTAQEAAETRLRELQDELTHISRISAMGIMAATLAHELNQPLTSIACYLETALELLREPVADKATVVREGLSEAASEALRAGGIVRSLREFVSRSERERIPQSIMRLIDESCTLGLLGAHERGILCRIDVNPPDATVICDRIQIQQVLINLLRNAVDATALAKRGEIEVRAFSHDDVVEVVVGDRGVGLDPAVKDQLFTAFVSTKRKGMGLGLSICRTIVEAHGGKIWANSRVGGGTEFHFTLPRANVEGENG